MKQGFQKAQWEGGTIAREVRFKPQNSMQMRIKEQILTRQTCISNHKVKQVGISGVKVNGNRKRIISGLF